MIRRQAVTRLPLRHAVLMALRTLSTPCGDCRASLRELSQAAGYSPESVRRTLRDLTAVGSIAVSACYDIDGARLSNRYRLKGESALTNEGNTT